MFACFVYSTRKAKSLQRIINNECWVLGRLGKRKIHADPPPMYGLSVISNSDNSVLDFRDEAFICKNLFCQHLGERCNCKLHLFFENYKHKMQVREIRLANKGLTVFPKALLWFVNLELLDVSTFFFCYVAE